MSSFIGNHVKFISSVLDPLQKQVDCHQVTARKNLKVRLTQKFLFYKSKGNVFFYRQKCPLGSLYTFCAEMGCELLIS